MLPDECGFCERTLDPGEELIPIYSGEPDVDAEPATGSVITHSEQVVVDSDEEFNTPKEIARAVQDVETIGVEIKPVQEVVHGTGGGVEPVIDREAMQDGLETPEFERAHDKVAVEVTYRIPVKRVLEWTDYEITMPEPDIEVCEHCRHAFTEGSDNE